MQSKLRRHGLAVLAAAAMAMASGAPAQNTTCPGSCNNDQRVTAAELTRMVAVVLLCGGAPSGCPQVAGGCPAGDVNGDGSITVDEIVLVINNILRYDTGCPPPPATFTPTNTLPPTATNTPTVTSTPSHTPQITDTPTRTVPPSDTPTPAPTATATATHTPPPSPTSTQSPTATITNTPGPQVCGNGVIEGDEECDDGGICTGGDNAGTACTSEADCLGFGVCEAGLKIGTQCADDSECPASRCVHCRPFGGDGCAANCTFEADVQGLIREITPTPPAPPAPTPTPTLSLETSWALVKTEVLNLVLPLRGRQTLTVGKRRAGVMPFVVKFGTLSLDRIPVSILACACVRPVEAKTCGGVLFKRNGAQAVDCSLADNCAALGEPPCSFLHGPGNSASGVIGCDGLVGVDLTITQDAGCTAPPPAPTPPPNAGPPVVTLSGNGPPGSVILLSTQRIGLTSGSCTFFTPRPTSTPANPTPKPTPTPTPDAYGPDLEFCTDDDSLGSRGNPATLALTTGNVSVAVLNHYRQAAADCITLGPVLTRGAPLNCDVLESASPSIVNSSFAGGFTTLNQITLGDAAIVNRFHYSTPHPEPNTHEYSDTNTHPHRPNQNANPNPTELTALERDLAERATIGTA